MQIKERLFKVIADTLGINTQDICESKIIVNDLGADSIDTIEIIMAVEKEFKIDLDDDYFMLCESNNFSVGDLLKFVRDQIEEEDPIKELAELRLCP